MSRGRKSKARQRAPHSIESRRARSARMKQLTDAERFWAKVRVPPEGDETSCWQWLGATNRQGYGVFMVGSKVDGTRRTVLAHRFAWELVNGPLPDGVVLLHECDNPPCVRHTRSGTQLENIADMVAKGRHVPPPVRRGPKGIAALREAAGESQRATRRLQEVERRSA